MSEDTRPHVYVHTDHNPDDVRVFYEVPDVIVEALQQGTPDHFTFAQVLADILRRWQIDLEEGA